MQGDVPLDQVNTTELLQMLLQQRGFRLRRAVPRGRLIELLSDPTAHPPHPEEWSGTVESRKELQDMIALYWEQVNSQLPCVGETRGQCTAHPCSDGRHIECRLSSTSVRAR